MVMRSRLLLTMAQIGVLRMRRRARRRGIRIQGR